MGNRWPPDVGFWRTATAADITHYLGLGANPITSLDGVESGDGPLHAAVRMDNVEAYMALNSAAPGRLESRNADGDTLLHIATAMGSVEMIGLLLDGGANLWAQRKAGETALHIAVYGRDIAAINFLLSVGAAEKDFRNKDGETLLHWTASHGEVELTMALIAGGANVLASNIHGEIPLHCATHEGEEETARVLMQASDGSERIENRWGQSPLDVYKARMVAPKTPYEDDSSHVVRLTDNSPQPFYEQKPLSFIRELYRKATVLLHN